MHGCVSERGGAGGHKADELFNDLEIHVATCYQVVGDDANPKWVSRSGGILVLRTATGSPLDGPDIVELVGPQTARGLLPACTGTVSS